MSSGTAKFALHLALVGGVFLGSFEALATMRANTFVQPEQYLLVYATVPLLCWTMLAILMLVPVAIVVHVVRVRSEKALQAYAAVLAAAGVASALAPTSLGIAAGLRTVGAEIVPAVQLLLLPLMAVLTAGCAAIAWCAAGAYAGPLSTLLPDSG